MKTKLALLLAGTTLAVTNIVPLAMAYESHENVFYSNDKIKQMSQEQGDKYCNDVYGHLLRNGRLPRRIHINWVRALHKWAHIENGDCVVNVYP
ncbi:MAG: hypothetical protein AAFQ80_08815 [Cyanobacteria bacterium J06621_8]